MKKMKFLISQLYLLALFALPFVSTSCSDDDDNSTKVGQIWIATKNDTAKLARLFVLPKYQNKGYATKAIIDIEKLYSYYNHWQLDTIKEEKKNVHLYQKLGYKPNGKEKIINDKMTITEFEKEINDERSN